MIENSFYENFPTFEGGEGVKNPKNVPFSFVPAFEVGEGVTREGTMSLHMEIFFGRHPLFSLEVLKFNNAFMMLYLVYVI